MTNEKDSIIGGFEREADNGDTKPVFQIVWILYVFVKWKTLIITTVFTVMVITAGLSLLSDKWYESTAVVLLPEKTGSALDALSSSGGSLSGIGVSILGGGVTNVSRYMAILNSRRLREDLIGKYDLLNAYKIEKMDDMLKVLEKDINAEADKKLGTINITFRYFNDPQKTADIANYIVLKLDEINRELATEQARFTRQFIENRYQQAKKDLQISEDSLNFFQKKFGVISIPEQTKAGIEAAAKLQAEMVSTEIDYNIKKKTLGKNHPNLMILESQMEELRKTQKQLDRGGVDLGIFIPFKETPDLALRYLRLYRDVQINGKILEFLIPQFEQAKIQEAKDTPTLLVLDKAMPADYSFKPRKKIITLVSGLIAGVVVLFLLYFKEYMWKSLIDNKQFQLILGLFTQRKFK